MFEIINQTNFKVPEIKEVKKVIELAIKLEKLKNVEFNIILVDNEKIHQLNLEYRKKDQPTDVITFALEDNADPIMMPIRMLGDIYISIDKAIEQAKEFEHSFLRELSFLAVHGFYHLLGYDHLNDEDEKIMFTKQEEVLSNAKITR